MLQRILFLGALFQWRIAVGLFCIPPIICIFILATIAPESPSWLMSKGKDAEALKGIYDILGLTVQEGVPTFSEKSNLKSLEFQY